MICYCYWGSIPKYLDRSMITQLLQFNITPFFSTPKKYGKKYPPTKIQLHPSQGPITSHGSRHQIPATRWSRRRYVWCLQGHSKSYAGITSKGTWTSQMWAEKWGGKLGGFWGVKSWSTISRCWFQAFFYFSHMDWLVKMLRIEY